MKRNVYRCEFLMFDPEFRDRAVIRLLEPRSELLAEGDMCSTSRVLYVDFVNGVIVTKNSIYLFDAASLRS